MDSSVNVVSNQKITSSADEYLITVVIPTTRPGFVREAVDSVLQQTFKVHEIIVVFDGRTDSAELTKIRNELPEQVQVLATGQRSNANCARNLGAAHASGNYIALLDDDDLWEPEKVGRQVDALRLFGVADTILVACQIRTIGIEDQQVWPATPPPTTGAVDDYLLRYRPSFGPNYIQTSTWLLPTSTLRNRPLDEDVQIHQDLDWLIRNGNAHSNWLLFIAEPLVQYRIVDSTSVSRSNKWRLSYSWIVDKSLPAFRRNRGDFLLVNVYPRAIEESWLRAIVLALEAALLYRAHLGSVAFALRHIARKINNFTIRLLSRAAEREVSK